MWSERRGYATRHVSVRACAGSGQPGLRTGGGFLIRIFQGESFGVYLKSVRENFDKVQVCKSLSSRGRSREQYLLARGFRGA
ncbi:Ribosomal RNA large subunit methyltransferase E [compost metagenome]